MEELGFSSDENSQSTRVAKENVTPRPKETYSHDNEQVHGGVSAKHAAQTEPHRESWGSSEQETPGFESESPGSSGESCQEQDFVPALMENSKSSEEARVLAEIAMSELSLGGNNSSGDRFNAPSEGSRESMEPSDLGAYHDTKVKNVTMAKKMLLRSELRNSSSTSETAGSCSMDGRKSGHRHGKHGRHGGGRGPHARHPPHRRPRGRHRRSGHGGRVGGGWQHGREHSPPPPPPPPSGRNRGSNAPQEYHDPERRPTGRLEPQVEACVLNLLQALSDCYGDMATSLIPQPQVRPHLQPQYSSNGGLNGNGSSNATNNVNLIPRPSQTTPPPTNPYAGYLPVLAQNAAGTHVPAWVPADLVYGGGSAPTGVVQNQENATDYQHLAYHHGYYENDGESGGDSFNGRGGEEYREER